MLAALHTYNNMLLAEVLCIYITAALLKMIFSDVAMCEQQNLHLEMLKQSENEVAATSQSYHSNNIPEDREEDKEYYRCVTEFVRFNPPCCSHCFLVSIQ
jgi:hypothetical protein